MVSLQEAAGSDCAGDKGLSRNICILTKTTSPKDLLQVFNPVTLLLRFQNIPGGGYSRPQDTNFGIFVVDYLVGWF